MFLSQLLRGLKKKPPRSADSLTALRAFRLQYSQFKDLLSSNAEMGILMAEIDRHLHDNTPFSMNKVHALATRSVFHTTRMAKALNALSGEKHQELFSVISHINTKITTILNERPKSTITCMTLPIDQVDQSLVDAVGGKCAGFGEIRNRLKLPTPDGFAVTLAATQAFLERKELRAEIQKHLRNADPSNPPSIFAVSKSITSLIYAEPFPQDLTKELHKAWDHSFPENSLAVLRSSALDEDGPLSFSGQYKTVLGVERAGLTQAFREVLASLFSPRAVTYRLHHGLSFGHCGMGMLCIKQLHPRSSGVLFSRHPVDPTSEMMVLHGVWGLGAYAADGIIEPDCWEIHHSTPPEITSVRLARKHVRLDMCAQDTRENPVPENMQRQLCLPETAVLQLAKMALTLEEHAHHPQDIEWAMEQDGRLLLLQSRPMRMPAPAQEAEPQVPGALLLLDQAETICSGSGCGPIVPVHDLADLENFPENGILVAPHSLPAYALIMNRAQAIITEAGSSTGHMASLAREFQVPALTGVTNALQMLKPGSIVTVDATNGRIYAGEIQELRTDSPQKLPLADTPVHAILRLVAEHITPLHLLDPKSALFAPKYCLSLHDVMRFVHERCYQKMFDLSDQVSTAKGLAVKLQAPVPLDLHIIDLGEGLRPYQGCSILPEQILSTPLRALLQGMLLPEVHAQGPRPVHLGGFFSVMTQHILEAPTTQNQRFGDRSYCIISDKYMNFSSRVGYHYSIIDAYCGQTESKNYITFQFKGGAANEIRRQRRVRCIAEILCRLHFSCEVYGDMVQACLHKYPITTTKNTLDQLGRLLIMTRQMDMLMTSEDAVLTMAENFIQENYH